MKVNVYQLPPSFAKTNEGGNPAGVVLDADSLNIDASHMLEDLPAQIVFTGLRDILIPVKSMEILNAMKPDMEKLTPGRNPTLCLNRAIP